MYYVISDIHGCLEEFIEALTHWNREDETLIVMGDLIDRGPDSFEVVQMLYYLKAMYPEQVVVLKGNHDESFTNWLLDTPEEELGFYYMKSHEETVRSFYGYELENIVKFNRDTRKQRGQHIRHLYMKELRFLENLPMYHETENCIFVHAGINLKIENWRDDETSMNTIRNAFMYSSTEAPKRVFFGHTPTALIRDEEGCNGIWISEYGDKIGIDGGCAFGGQLNAVKISENGDIMYTVVIQKEEEIHA